MTMFLFAALFAGDVSMKDLARFPDAKECKAAIERNDRRANELAAATADDADGRKRIDDNKRAVAASGKAWRELQEAHDGNLTDAERIKALDNLRKIIGDNLYQAGDMPSPVPAELVAPPKDEQARGRCKKHRRGGRGCGSCRA